MWIVLFMFVCDSILDYFVLAARIFSIFFFLCRMHGGNH